MDVTACRVFDVGSQIVTPLEVGHQLHGDADAQGQRFGMRIAAVNSARSACLEIRHGCSSSRPLVWHVGRDSAKSMASQNLSPLVIQQPNRDTFWEELKSLQRGHIVPPKKCHRLLRGAKGWPSHEGLAWLSYVGCTELRTKILRRLGVLCRCAGMAPGRLPCEKRRADPSWPLTPWLHQAVPGYRPNSGHAERGSSPSSSQASLSRTTYEPPCCQALVPCGPAACLRAG